MPMIGGSNKLLNIHQAAGLLSVPETRLRGYWKIWGIKAYKVGRELRFRERDLWTWVYEHPGREGLIPTNNGGSKKLLSVKETAELLATSPDTVYRQWKIWGMKAYRVGRELRFREQDVEAWLEQHPAD